MQNEIQLLSFFVSFLFGIIFAFLNEFNNKLIAKGKKGFKIAATFLFIINISLLYLLLMYKINEGVIHLYFLLFVVLGYIISFPKIKVLTKSVNRLSNFIKNVKKKIKP